MLPARSRVAWLAPLLLLTGCGGGEEPAPGGVTQNEKQALDDAAEMLDKANNAADLPRDPEPTAP
jgi:hypothetical protein